MAAALNLKLVAVNFLCIFPFLISLSEAGITSHIHDSVGQSKNQTPFCQDGRLSFLPPSYRYQKGFNCSPAWGSVSFKYSQDNENVTTIILSCDQFSGWIGIGFSKDGGMVGSSAAVGWTGGDGKDKDKVDPGIAKFSLQGKDTGSVTSFVGDFNFTKAPPFVLWNNNSFYMGFRAKFNARLGRQYMILARGTDQPSLPHPRKEVLLTRHTDQAVMQIDLSPVFDVSSVDNPGRLKITHGAIGAIAWGVLLPFGAIIPRYFKHYDPQWFYLHVSIQFVGFLLGLATVVIGRTLYNGVGSTRISKFQIHGSIGVLVFCLSLLQVMALILRPNKASKWSKHWKWYHHWAGRLALFLGALNIVFGLCFAEADSGWKIGYGFLVTFILATIIRLEASLELGRSKKGDATPFFGCN